MGHVDHGKSTILDRSRGTKVVAREAGGITQHIGATDVPIETIYALCSKLIGERRFNVPGLLFIDTPGHYSFVTLRTRGGALADLGVLGSGASAGITVSLPDRPLLIGRAAEADLHLDDAQVSKEHARIEWTGAGWSITDLDSSFGTWVNGVRVSRRDLSPMDRITIGSTVLVFERDAT